MRPIVEIGHKEDRRKHRHRRHGFSHPARFEILEQRMPLSAAPASTEFGNPAFVAPFVEENGLFPLPGAASTTNGTNPANLALVNVTGSEVPTSVTMQFVDGLAFNNPSWATGDRTLGLITTPENNGLPANAGQVAATPFGIRNFLIGANTSVAHGNTAPIGRGISVGQRPSAVETKVSQAIEHPLDEGLLEFPTDHRASETEQSQVAANGSQDVQPPAPVPPPIATVAEALSLEERPALELDRAAVDQAMAERGETNRAVVEVAVAEPERDGVPMDDDSPAGGTQALAAGTALATTIALHRPQAWQKTDLDSWRTERRPHRTRRCRSQPH